MMLNSKSIGNKIAEARKKINLSPSELAQQVSVIQRGANGNAETPSRTQKLKPLAEIFGVTFNCYAVSFNPKKLQPYLMKNYISE